ncbi:hypothetical protein CR513_50357, partial [Mucuna pruriens]
MNNQFVGVPSEKLRNYIPNKVKLDWPNPFQEDEPSFLFILGYANNNGILCLHLFPNTFVLWNPATKELKVIPPSLVESVPPNQDPLVSLHEFGYDHVKVGVKQSWTKLFIVGSLSNIDDLIEVGNKGDIFFRKKNDD